MTDQPITERPLHGLVIMDNIGGKSGASRAIATIKPHLKAHGITLYLIAAKTGYRLARSLTRCLVKEKQRRYDFVLFNALGSLSTPYSRYLAALFLLARLPILIYWRELSYSFDKNASIDNFAQARSIQRLLTDDHVLHLANSAVTGDYIQQRYAAISPVVVHNSAYIPAPFDEPVLPTTDPPIVLNVGSIQPRKGTDLFVETAIKVCQAHPTVEFIWLGAGPDFGNWRAAIAQAGLTNRILFPGHLDAPHLLLRRASVAFISSREESFSQVTAEGMCLAREVVTFASGGPPEVLGGTGTIIPDFDTTAAADAILDLLARPKTDLMNTAARERYLDWYTPQKHALRLSATIRSVVRA